MAQKKVVHYTWICFILSFLGAIFAKGTMVALGFAIGGKVSFFLPLILLVSTITLYISAYYSDLLNDIIKTKKSH